MVDAQPWPQFGREPELELIVSQHDRKTAGGGIAGAKLQIWPCKRHRCPAAAVRPGPQLGGFYLIRNPQTGLCAFTGLSEGVATVTDCVPVFDPVALQRNNMFVPGPQIR
jgi:hypothetical protein